MENNCAVRNNTKAEMPKIRPVSFAFIGSDVCAQRCVLSGSYILSSVLVKYITFWKTLKFKISKPLWFNGYTDLGDGLFWSRSPLGFNTKWEDQLIFKSRDKEEAFA